MIVGVNTELHIFQFIQTQPSLGTFQFVPLRVLTGHPCVYFWLHSPYFYFYFECNNIDFFLKRHNYWNCDGSRTKSSLYGLLACWGTGACLNPVRTSEVMSLLVPSVGYDDNDLQIHLVLRQREKPLDWDRIQCSSILRWFAFWSLSFVIFSYLSASPWKWSSKRDSISCFRRTWSTRRREIHSSDLWWQSNNHPVQRQELIDCTFSVPIWWTCLIQDI